MSKKLEELERRIRELEARPVYVPIYIGSPQPSYPCPQPLPWYAPRYPTWRPWYGIDTVATCGAQEVTGSAYQLTGNE